MTGFVLALSYLLLLLRVFFGHDIHFLFLGDGDRDGFNWWEVPGGS
jgi:hypothetical protein